MSSAFCPGHVTGVFAVHDASPNPLARGSRGAGWSLQKGAYATVTAAEATVVRIDGQEAEAEVTRFALDRLTSQPVTVDIRLEMPQGQGFGMSAAGTLAACLAATDELRLEPEKALEAAHTAEVELGTGLGDVVGAWFGGGELRIKPGCPPRGWAMQIPAPEGTEFLFCTLGERIPTRSIIRSHDWKERTRRFGDPAVDVILELGRDRAWSEVLHQSSAFTSALGLQPDAMVALGKQLPEGCRWGQVMLGSTLWVTGAAGDLDRAEALLEGHGPIQRAAVDPNGARLVRGVPVP